jgi:biopolymer transport protein ExbD
MSNFSPTEEFMLDAPEEPVVVRRNRVLDAEMDITPMIDMTMLLLIFFLVGTRMSTEAHVELPKARYGTAVTTKDAVILTLMKGATEDRAAVYGSDGPLPAALLNSRDLAVQEQQIIQYVKSGVSSSGKKHVVIKAARGVKHRDVARVAEAAGRAAETQLYVAVLEEG